MPDLLDVLRPGAGTFKASPQRSQKCGYFQWTRGAKETLRSPGSPALRMPGVCQHSPGPDQAAFLLTSILLFLWQFVLVLFWGPQRHPSVRKALVMWNSRLEILKCSLLHGKMISDEFLTERLIKYKSDIISPLFDNDSNMLPSAEYLFLSKNKFLPG